MLERLLDGEENQQICARKDSRATVSLVQNRKTVTVVLWTHSEAWRRQPGEDAHAGIHGWQSEARITKDDSRGQHQAANGVEDPPNDREGAGLQYNTMYWN